MPLDVPKQDGEYLLWLFHLEELDSVRGVLYDTSERKSPASWSDARRVCCPRRKNAGAVALTRINVRLGRMVQCNCPCLARVASRAPRRAT